MDERSGAITKSGTLTWVDKSLHVSGVRSYHRADVIELSKRTNQPNVFTYDQGYTRPQKLRVKMNYTMAAEAHLTLSRL